MSDLIDRQDAIDALLYTQKVNANKFESKWLNDLVAVVIANDIEAIVKLPTAQPEIIRCKDCKHAYMTVNGECKYCEIWFTDDAYYMDGDYYCGCAERKENE